MTIAHLSTNSTVADEKPANADRAKNSDSSQPVSDFYHGDHYIIEESLGYLLKQSHAALQRDIDVLMQPLDLTAMQWGPLLMISHGKGDTAADIARCAGIDTGAVTRMLDRLEAKGLVARKRSEGDRRVVHLELTEEGVQTASKIPYVLAQCLNKRLQGFNADELATFKSLLRRMLANNEA